ncbi:MAG TPA: DNA polymerase Y family protein [Opitutaceae bacterium]|jgi:protein ImuB|nr:DNA polymerase Y family protein [Opitutaceae bacterium]
MNYAVLVVPNFALHALRRSDPTLTGQPVALIAGEGRKAAITQVSPEATGVTPGLVVTLAMARCPGIVLRPRDFAAEIEADALLRAAAFTLSPRVELTSTGCCTVDLQGADPERTSAEIRLRVMELTAAGLPVRIGIAATPLLAVFAARCAEPVLVVDDEREFLHPLPLAFAEPTAEQAEILSGWAVRTLGQLTALSKAEVGQRLGTAGVALWERAAGETTRPLRLSEPAQSFAVSWDYNTPIESLEPLLFRLRRFSERVAMELRAAGFVAEILSLTLLLEDETDHRREFRLPEANTDVDGWMRVFLSHLESVRTAARITKARLVAHPTRPPQKQDGLFDTGLRDPAAFWENLARLAAIVGDGRVGTPVAADTYRPDTFTLSKPVDTIPAPEPAPVHPLRGLALRRFRPPWPVCVACAGSQPVELDCANLRDTVCNVSGPWRISGDWWTPEAWAVEHWHVEMAKGGIYQLSRSKDGWRVEGVFD